MTPLAEELIARITRDGPITIADYMNECLMHPHFGYYATRDPLGQAGDFITAPEISQMFGEVIGLFLAQSWIDRDRPDHFVLAELGPGRGTLMADALRAASGVAGFAEATDLHLVETSPVLRQRQIETIPAKLTHHETVATLPEGPLFLVANEFFDALPIRQFQRSGSAWRERVLGVTKRELTLGLSDLSDPPALSHRRDDTLDGQIVETSRVAEAVVQEIGARIDASGGIALIIDYGDWRSLGDTLQAVRGHEPVDILDAPGTSDLTAHVDFEALARAAAPAAHTRVAPQGIFLERLGITARANALAATGDSTRFQDIAAAHRRLTHPEEMGTLFKAMAIHRATDPTPPGFTNDP